MPRLSLPPSVRGGVGGGSGGSAGGGGGASTAATLPWLPEAWLAGIAAGEYVERARGELSGTKAAFAWIKKRPESRGEPCKMMAADVAKAVEALTESSGGGAHDTLVNALYRLIANGAEGHRGCHTAVTEVGRAFVREVAGRRKSALLEGGAAGTVRTREEARREVGRAVVGAVRLMLGTLNQPWMVEAGLSEGAGSCSCWDAPVDDPAGAKDPYEYPMNDTGNAEHLIDIVDGDILWVPEHEKWFVWTPDAGVWRRSNVNLGMQYARKVAPRVKAAADQRFESLAGLDSADSEAERRSKEAAKLSQWAEKCGARSALTNMLEVARSYDPMVCDASKFDAEPRLLHCPDGSVIELTDEGLHVREGRKEDLLTLSTGAPYVQGATDPLWENYLDTFIPDAALRWYVQRLLGYSLFGGNPRRQLVFFQGPTSSGKSTILEAAGAAVGAYGGAFAVSVFREKQDEGPRADLVRILDQRLVFASEAGSEWYLHADQIKRMTGGDSITARLPHKGNIIEKVPAFTPFIATNSTPRIPGADAALWRRLVAVPFDVQVDGKRDDALARDRLRTSGSALTAILSWMLRGWEGYCAEGLDDAPPAVLERTRKMRSGVSDFHEWFHAQYELTKNPKDRIPGDRMYELYRAEMAAADIDARHQLNRIQFGKKVTDEGSPVKVGKMEGKAVRFRINIRNRRR